MSIIVRPFEEKDKPAIEAMHAGMKLDYEKPDWNSMLVSAVVEVDGQLSMAAFLRKTAETYMLLDPELGSKKGRLGQLLMLHRELMIPARKAGFNDVGAFLPPSLEPHFGKLLMHIGWKKALWPHYFMELK
ncbi:MAG TPA: hypothetical protein VHV32_19390 [Candidatus Angelobacter sp.]|jgi:hypothetical protein|nr:hypothetical protein [Candidatus Angelobacter sp.]